MDDGKIKELRTLIEAQCHSGLNSLDEDVTNQIKKICKTSDAYAKTAYDCIIQQLKKKNCQIRLSAFQICKELFSQSNSFQLCLLDDIDKILQLTAEVNSKCKLPPPQSAAKKLKILALTTFKSWAEEYGWIHKPLKIAYNYLKNIKKINFDFVNGQTVAEQNRQNDVERVQRARSDEKRRKLMEEVQGNELEIQNTIVSLSNCLSLLLPPPEDFFIPDNTCDASGEEAASRAGSSSTTDQTETDASDSNLRTFGLTRDYSLNLEISPSEKIVVTKTDENSSIIENARDCVQLITNRYLPMVKKWSQICTKYSNGKSEEIKKILGIKEELMRVLEKYEKLKIDGGKVERRTKDCTNEEDDGDGDEDEDEEDDEFEEVKKEGYEEFAKLNDEDCLTLSAITKPSSTVTGEKKESSQGSSTLSSSSKTTVEEPQPCSSKDCSTSSDSRKSKLMKIAPKLPFDIDLYHWEDEKLTPPMLISTKMDVDKFWGCAASDDVHVIPNPEGVASLRTRVIEFTGKFVPVKWSCRAPLPNGKLCPRKDRVKCPFHGKIVARDERGVRSDGAEDKSSSVESATPPDWQDPALLAELKACTGIDLKMPEGKGKKRKSYDGNLTQKKMRTSAAALKVAKEKNFPGLVDVIKKQNTSYTRLSKKIFNKSSIKKVCSTLDKIDRKKFNDKFGDCFNYS